MTFRTLVIVGLVVTVIMGAGAIGYYWFTLRLDGQANRPERPPPAVVLADVIAQPVTRTLQASGTVTATDSVTVTSESAGRIASIEFTDGQTVQRGEVVVRLDDTAARAEVRTREAEAAEIEQSLGRAQALAPQGFAPRATVADTRRRLEAARQQIAIARERLDDTIVRAPFAGRLGLRDISVGAVIEAGGEVATLDAINPIDLRFSVPEQNLGQIRTGAAVEATTPAFPNRVFTGQIHAIGRRVDPALRTLTIEARLPNPNGTLLPGMLMNVEVVVGEIENAAVVPPIAVIVEGSEHFVYQVGSDGTAQKVVVTIGQREPERLQIASGLAPGDKIIVEGLQAVTDGQPVQVAAQPQDTRRTISQAEAGDEP